MTTWIGSDTDVTLAMWTPDYDSIIAWEQSRSGLVTPEWIKETCVKAAGAGVRLSHAINRNGALMVARKRDSQIQPWVSRWAESFERLWSAKAAEVRLPDWKAIVVSGSSDPISSRLGQHVRLSRSIEDGVFDRAPDRLTMLTWADVEENWLKQKA